MTQALLALNAMLLSAQGILLASGADLGLTTAVQVLINGAISVVLSGISIYLPKVSELVRQTIGGLQRRGN